VTGIVALLRDLAPTLSLGALYVLAVLPVAVLYGRAWAIAVSVASMLVFNFVFIPPTYALTLHGGENWLVFAVYVITGLLVSDLAARARKRAREAEQREREAALLAELSATLLSGATVAGQLPRIAASAARIMNVPSTSIELGAPSATGEGVLPLTAGERAVGLLRLPPGAQPDSSVSDRFVPALASVLGIALDRERLAGEALEAEALRRSDALKTALLRAVSHDLRSPLTAIRATIEALDSSELELDERQREALLHSALVESARLDRMVGNLLDLSRLEAGVARPEPRPRTAEMLIRQAASQLNSEGRIDILVRDPDRQILVDPGQLERALVNLLENALKFSPSDSTVTVEVSCTDAEVQLRLVDRGPGLLPGERERVFEPFWHGSARRDRRGAGLGLAIARGFVEANGGRLWAEEAPSGGAAFVIALPAQPQPAGVVA
jgi:two-component system, OmpR family, sensor histidine kinase KdpD